MNALDSMAGVQLVVDVVIKPSAIPSTAASLAAAAAASRAAASAYSDASASAPVRSAIAGPAIVSNLRITP